MTVFSALAPYSKSQVIGSAKFGTRSNKSEHAPLVPEVPPNMNRSLLIFPTPPGATFSGRQRAALLAAAGALAWGAHVLGSPVEFTVTDGADHQPVPCRIHLTGPDGKPVRAANLPFFRDHFSCLGSAQLELAPGEYHYEIERGPEFMQETGSFTTDAVTPRKVAASLDRICDLAKEGWFSGDLHIHRPPGDIEVLMRAEDLHIAPVMTWWNKTNLWSTERPPAPLLVHFDRYRFYHLMAGEDEREGGALLYFNRSEPLPITGAAREWPSPMTFLAMAREKRGAWIDVEKPFWWDAPVWFASGQVDSVGLANNHMDRSQMSESEAWGHPRDTVRLPPPLGNGFWSQEIYYHLLNCGLRLPPSAGSASGVLPNPVGYNRVWVQCGAELTWEKWWDGLRAGRSFVSNGPLLRVKANGQWPGAVFTGLDPIELEAALDGRDPMPSIEIIKNGQLERAVTLDEWRKNGGKLGTLKFNESGWFLVRVITDNAKTFRFASTAPFYVEVGDTKRRVSRASAQFFLEWVRERMARVKLPEGAQRDEVLGFQRAAETFWREKATQANAD